MRIGITSGRRVVMELASGRSFVEVGPTPPPDPILWVLADQGITGTGSDVDSWDTRSTSGLVLSSAGVSTPTVALDLVEMGNAAGVGDAYFEVGTTATFQSVTETGVFSLAWRGRIDSYDTPELTIDCSILHTRGSTGTGCNLFIYSGGSSLALVTWDSSGTITHRCDHVGFSLDYTLGDPLDIVVTGDGTNMRMYLDGVEVGTTGTVVTSAGAHAITPVVGRLANAPLFFVGAMEGMFFDDSSSYSVADLRTYVDVGLAP